MTKMTLAQYFSKYLVKICGETLFMVGIASLLAIVFGLVLGGCLFLLRRGQKTYQKHIYKGLSLIINIFRSFPFMILMFALTGFTRIIMKMFTGTATSTGNGAAIVCLTIAAIPFFAKIIENALIEVNEGIIEAATSLGLSPLQIIARVVVKEALPAIISGVTLSIVTLIGFSAIVCNIGAGGIGAFAYSYGYINMDTNAMLYAIVTIIVLVQIVQIVGNLLYKLVK